VGNTNRKESLEDRVLSICTMMGKVRRRRVECLNKSENHRTSVLGICIELYLATKKLSKAEFPFNDAQACIPNKNSKIELISHLNSQRKFYFITTKSSHVPVRDNSKLGERCLIKQFAYRNMG